ncbi:hypothetical protein F4821DRAFT_97829 [Hypoxylon rubiginosum]|uniref:Uncharacterized protein n=1 Tax=Hypoxylon rubiginosum TaxID=110542 RepID=A0ACC0D5P4_9PEZI|nr:hypothetical protein F4821DRAFT_97829 [Hypoxylon rubiginosum]
MGGHHARGPHPTININIISTATIVINMVRCTLCRKTFGDRTFGDHRAANHLGVVCHFPGTHYPNLRVENDAEMIAQPLEANRQRGGGQSGNRWVCRWPNCGHRREDFASEKNLAVTAGSRVAHAPLVLRPLRIPSSGGATKPLPRRRLRTAPTSRRIGNAHAPVVTTNPLPRVAVMNTMYKLTLRGSFSLTEIRGSDG